MIIYGTKKSKNMTDRQGKSQNRNERRTRIYYKNKAFIDRIKSLLFDIGFFITVSTEQYVLLVRKKYPLYMTEMK